MAMTSTWALPVYAVLADLDDWVDGAWWPADVEPAEQDAMILQASILVRDATAGLFYNADPTTGLPVVAAQAAVLKAAVGAQVQAWVLAGVRFPAAGGLTSGTTRAVSSMSDGGRSVSYVQDTTAQIDARAAATRQLAPAAAAILRGSGAIARTG